MDKIVKGNDNYSHLIEKISDRYTEGQRQAIISVNVHLLETYWQIGQYIVEFEQEGSIKAAYGKALLENLAKDLVMMHGRGFSLSNIKRMRQFYSLYPISATLSHQLSWSHYVELLKIENDLERSFYE